jgi:hypothetical protein
LLDGFLELLKMNKKLEFLLNQRWQNYYKDILKQGLMKSLLLDRLPLGNLNIKGFKGVIMLCELSEELKLLLKEHLHVRMKWQLLGAVAAQEVDTLLVVALAAAAARAVLLVAEVRDVLEDKGVLGNRDVLAGKNGQGYKC